MDDLKQLKEQYKEELLNNVLPFWIQHSIFVFRSVEQPKTIRNIQT